MAYIAQINRIDAILKHASQSGVTRTDMVVSLIVVMTIKSFNNSDYGYVFKQNCIF